MRGGQQLGACILIGLLAPGVVGSASAQIAPRLTGTAVITQLETAQHDLATRATSLPHSSLGTTSAQLGKLVDELRDSLGKDAAKPIDLLDKDAKGRAYRASAVAQRTEAYLEAAKGCLEADATAMADALAANVGQVAAGSGSSKTLPVINAVETMDHRPLFVLHPSSKDLAFALVGANLFDAQCESPVVTATDAQGKPQAVQPGVTGVLPNRIELKLPAGARLQAGNYVLHVVAKHKAFLVGCSTQPEAVAAVQVAAPVTVSVSYALTPTCRAGGAEHSLPAVIGTMPDLVDGTAAQSVAINGCPEPVSYAIAATVTFGGGRSTSVGPFSQIASAGITAGLPGGLSLSWDPSVHQIFVRAAAKTCKGVY